MSDIAYASAAQAAAFHTLHLREEALPELTSRPLVDAPQQPYALAAGLDQVALAEAPPAWARAVNKADSRLRANLTHLWQGPADDALSGDALMEHDLRPGHSGRTPYIGVHLDGVTHHVWARGAPPRHDARDRRRVEVVSGVCLYSMPAVWLVTATDRRISLLETRGRNLTEPIIAIEADPRPTLPELEGALRLSTFAASVIARVPSDEPAVFRPDTPYLAYPLYGWQAALDGFWPARLLARWTDWALGRHHQMVRRQARAFRATLAGRRPVRVRIQPELVNVALHLRAALARGRVPSLEELVNLACRHDWIWRGLIDVAPPTTPLDLAKLTYIAAAYRAGQPIHGQRSVVVFVDDPQEWPILERLRQRAAEMTMGDPVSAIGLYPLSRFWVQPTDEDRPRPDLYAHDPGRHATDQDGRRIDLAGLAASIYQQASIPR
ncbi:hypothetical protein [Nonomuraea maheshkhaliensis]|uniref:hypothetical protein n=1 Tax=Nonomuraea maheshkhaliensis TaxID=419590 RepID=UPI0031F9A96C